MRDKLLFAREAGEWTCDDDGCFVVLDGDAAPRPASRAELDAAALSTRAVDLKSSDAVQALLDESSSLYNIDECIVIYNDDNEPEILCDVDPDQWRELLSDADTERLDSMNAARARGMV